jgi:hypothetical protein
MTTRGKAEGGDAKTQAWCATSPSTPRVKSCSAESQQELPGAERADARSSCALQTQDGVEGIVEMRLMVYFTESNIQEGCLHQVPFDRLGDRDTGRAEECRDGGKAHAKHK